jgi:hypothetical protein
LIAQNAKAEGAEINWWDEKSLIINDVRGRSYQPKGLTLMAYAAGGKRHKLSMISRVTNQGKTRWMIIDEVFNNDKLVEFFEAMIKKTNK